MLRSELFKEVFEQSHVPQLLTTVDKKRSIGNRAFYNLIGYQKEEWELMTIKDISHPEDYLITTQLIKELIKGEREYYQLEKRFYHKDGSIIHGTLNVSLITDSEKNEKYLFAQIIDTTEKYQMYQSLMKSEKKYRLLAENCSDMIMLHDINGVYQYISPSIKTIMGYDTAELIGTTTPYNFIHPEDAQYVSEFHQQLLKG